MQLLGRRVGERENSIYSISLLLYLLRRRSVNEFERLEQRGNLLFDELRDCRQHLLSLLPSLLDLSYGFEAGSANFC